LCFAHIPGFRRLGLQFPDMPHRFVYSVPRLHGQAAIIHKAVELFDYLVTSSVHALSLG